MGYSIKEICDMVADDGFDFDTPISQKVRQLEEKRAELEHHLGYTKAIKLTGRFPSRPKEVGEVKFEDFQSNAIKRWNIPGDPQGEAYAQFAEMMLSKSNEERNNSDL